MVNDTRIIDFQYFVIFEHPYGGGGGEEFKDFFFVCTWFLYRSPIFLPTSVRIGHSWTIGPSLTLSSKCVKLRDLRCAPPESKLLY